jgi:uroporphyrinogen-III synthase
LAEEIIRHKVAEIVFFCGNKRRDELPSFLKQAGVKTQEVVVYETAETPATTTNEFDAVLFFSPSAVQSFFGANRMEPKTVCFAIGKTTAEEIQTRCDNKIIQPDLPGQNDMIKKLITYFHTVNSN